MKYALSIISTCLILITTFTACNQTKIESFYIPLNDKNVSEFNIFNDEAELSGVITTVSFVKVGENQFKTITSNSLIENLKKEFDDIGNDMKNYSFYTIKNNEIHLTGIDYFNITNSKRESIAINPSQIVLKLPSFFNKTEWIFKETSGDEYLCSAEFVNVDIDGTVKRAIKLTKRIIGVEDTWPNSIAYFVEGIGEWKVLMEKTGQLYSLLTKQYFDPDLKTTQDLTSNRKELTRANAQEGPSLSEQKRDEETCRHIVMNWSNLHNSPQVELFRELFSDTVFFYHKFLTNEDCVREKERLLKKYPSFSQKILGNIDIEWLNESAIKCSFSKYVTIREKEITYPSYLILRKNMQQWEITVESDLITDKNLSSKKSNL